jgi:hypothetical protein
MNPLFCKEVSIQYIKFSDEKYIEGDHVVHLQQRRAIYISNVEFIDDGYSRVECAYPD